MSTNVVSVARAGAIKGKNIGSRGSSGDFVLLVESGEEERYEHADFVVDCSGSFGNGNFFGPGGGPAMGERRCSSNADLSLTRTIPDVSPHAIRSLAVSSGSRLRGCS